MKNNLKIDKKKHGYWEIYYSDGGLAWKGNYVNGKQIGYWESFSINRKLHTIEYFIL